MDGVASRRCVFGWAAAPKRRSRSDQNRRQHELSYRLDSRRITAWLRRRLDYLNRSSNAFLALDWLFGDAATTSVSRSTVVRTSNSGQLVARVLRRDAGRHRLLALERGARIEVRALRAAVEIGLAARALRGGAPRGGDGQLVAAARALHHFPEAGHAEGLRRDRRLRRAACIPSSARASARRAARAARPGSRAGGILRSDMSEGRIIRQPSGVPGTASRPSVEQGRPRTSAWCCPRSRR